MKKVPKNNLVFIVENDAINTSLMSSEFAKNHAFEFVYFSSSSECLKALERHPVAVLIDYDLNSINSSEKDGMKILKEIKKLEHHTEVIFFSTHENTEVAVSSIKHGAYDYIVINDHRFLRLENVLNNLLDYLFAKRETLKYKMLTYGVLGLIAFWTIFTIIMFASGKWTSKPGVLIEGY